MPYVARPAVVEELAEGDPAAVAAENARRKAIAVAAAADELVLGVDTVVALDGRVHGKPPDAATARTTLRALAGRTHEVLSGFALRHGAEAPTVAIAVTRVTLRTLAPAQIDWYVGTGEWRERAGGYAIQARGAALVREIGGDYLNVVGLPVAALVDILPGLMTAAQENTSLRAGATRPLR